MYSSNASTSLKNPLMVWDHGYLELVDGHVWDQARNQGWEFGAFAPSEIFKILHRNFEICRSFQRIKMKFYNLNIFKKSYWNFSLSCLQWCSRDRNLRDRDLAQISRRDWDRDFVIKAETETRDHTFLWWLLNLTPWIMQQQNIWHIAKYQDNKNHPKFVQVAKYCKRSFSLSS